MPACCPSLLPCWEGWCGRRPRLAASVLVPSRVPPASSLGQRWGTRPPGPVPRFSPLSLVPVPPQSRLLDPCPLPWRHPLLPGAWSWLLHLRSGFLARGRAGQGVSVPVRGCGCTGVTAPSPSPTPDHLYVLAVLVWYLTWSHTERFSTCAHIRIQESSLLCVSVLCLCQWEWRVCVCARVCAGVHAYTQFHSC